MFDERRKLIACMLDIGKIMLTCGGEISRIEDTLKRIGLSYGAKKVNAFAIASMILVSIEFDDGEEITMTRRITKSFSNDFTKLEKLNALSRDFCTGNLSVDNLLEQFSKISSSMPSKIITYTGNALASGAFAMFFGGNIFDSILAALFGLFICFMQYKITPLCRNNLTFIFLVSLVTGFGISIISSPFSFIHPDKVIIGDIMLLIPGIAITNSVRDIFVGDTISGSMRFIECILCAAALAAGFMISILATGGIL